MRVQIHPLHLIFAAGLQACAPLSQSAGPTPTLQLPNTEWKVLELTGEQVPGKQPTLIFFDQNRSHGFAGCNRFFAQYEVNGTQLLISNVGSTRMSCEPDRNEIEQRFLRSLLAVRTVRSERNGLQLLDQEGIPLMQLQPGSQTR